MVICARNLRQKTQLVLKLLKALRKPITQNFCWMTLVTYSIPSWLCSKCRSRKMVITLSCFVDNNTVWRCSKLKLACLMRPLLLITPFLSEKCANFDRFPPFFTSSETYLLTKSSAKDSHWIVFKTCSSARINSSTSKSLGWLLNFKRKQNAITRTHCKKLRNLCQ